MSSRGRGSRLSAVPLWTDSVQAADREEDPGLQVLRGAGSWAGPGASKAQRTRWTRRRRKGPEGAGDTAGGKGVAHLMACSLGKGGLQPDQSRGFYQGAGSASLGHSQSQLRTSMCTTQYLLPTRDMLPCVPVPRASCAETDRGEQAFCSPPALPQHVSRVGGHGVDTLI